MRIDNPTKEKLREYNDNLFKYIKNNYSLECTMYLDLGVKTVRLLCYSKDFIPHIQKQLTYTLRETADRYDATIVLWHEPNIQQIYKYIFPELNPRNNFKRRIEMIQNKQTFEEVWIFDDKYSVNKSLMSTELWHDIFNSYDSENETYFYGVKNIDPEVFVQEGHIFVQILNNILKTENTNLVHGACIGLDNKGILLCARGQRGKSTLSVLAMMEGFEYVSDDYLTLEKEGNNLYAHPIYSIITLSPRMYNELYDKLDGCRFVSNNAKKDKYVINISKFHGQFKKKYPVKLCMFPEIVSDPEPSVKECNKYEKGRAITHLIHSTILQMNDFHDTNTVKKLIKMLEKYEFYKINLCNDIFKNVECLRDFMINKYKGV